MTALKSAGIKIKAYGVSITLSIRRDTKTKLIIAHSVKNASTNALLNGTTKRRCLFKVFHA